MLLQPHWLDRGEREKARSLPVVGAHRCTAVALCSHLLAHQREEKLLLRLDRGEREVARYLRVAGAHRSAAVRAARAASRSRSPLRRVNKVCPSLCVLDRCSMLALHLRCRFVDYPSSFEKV